MAIGLSNGKIMIYDIRDMVMAHQLDEPQGNNVAVNKIEFSNKGVFMAACWNELPICRVYSLHKQFAFSEISFQEVNLPVTTLSFDTFGGFLAIGTTQSVTISSYKNWKKTLATVRPFS